MKILLFGCKGQVGWQLKRALAVLGEVIALDRNSQPLCGNLAQPQALAETVRSVHPDVVVNAAAYTAVDRAESERGLAFAINATASEVLAHEAERIGAWLIHYSTDYVYNGSGERPWIETDPTGPLNAYGASKLAGDTAIAANCTRHLIFRTSWVFDSWGQNFLKTILRAAAQRDSLKVVCDQWGAPTRAALIADVTAHALARARAEEDGTPGLAGIYHLAASGFTHWQAYAALAIEEGIARGLPLRTPPAMVLPIPSADYAVAAPRPANSRLDTSRLRGTFGLHMPTWQEGVRSVVAEIAAQTLNQDRT